nr:MULTISPECIES: hypothetical protein [unclassified Polaromonas]
MQKKLIELVTLPFVVAVEAVAVVNCVWTWPNGALDDLTHSTSIADKYPSGFQRIFIRGRRLNGGERID